MSVIITTNTANIAAKNYTIVYCKCEIIKTCKCGQNYYCKKCGNGAGAMPCHCTPLPKTPRLFPSRLIMKILIIGIFCAFLFVASAKAQNLCPSGQVCLPHETANRLFKALEELQAARDVIAKFQSERGTSEAALNSALKVIESYKQLDEINGRVIAKYDAVIALYEKTLEMYSKLVEKFEQQLNKPRSAWQKFLSAIKTIGYILAGASLGRSL